MLHEAGGGGEIAYVTRKERFVSETCQKSWERGNDTIVNIFIPMQESISPLRT
jgi:hypothetical protein